MKMKKKGVLILLGIVFSSLFCMQFLPALAEAQQFLQSVERGNGFQDTSTTESCPSEYPVDCADGNCCAAKTVCVADSQCCAENLPYYCGNKICAATATDCPTELCPAQQVLGENNLKLDNLRSFRDGKLAQSTIGRKVIAIYYTNAESINAALDRSTALRAMARRVLETIAPVVESKEN